MRKYLGFAAGIMVAAALSCSQSAGMPLAMPEAMAAGVTMADSKDLAKTIRCEDNE